MVELNPYYFNQGAQTGTMLANNLAQATERGYQTALDRGKDSEFKQLYATAFQEKRQPTWDEVAAVYAKYGDQEGADRAKEKSLVEKAKKFEAKAELYSGQATAAFNSGNNDALAAIETNMNEDPDVQNFIGKIKFQPNNQISYVLNQDQDVLMNGGKVQRGSKGDQITAYKTMDSNGKPIYYATSIKPTAVSVADEKASMGGGGSPKSANTFIKRQNEYRLGGRDQFGIYQEGIDKAELGKAWKLYGQSLADTDTEIAQGYLKPATINEQATANKKMMQTRLLSELDKWKQKDSVKKQVRKGVAGATLLRQFMKESGIPDNEYETVTELLVPQPQQQANTQPVKQGA